MDFAKNMSVGDKVLIIVHHFPFAVVTVDGEYNYKKNRTRIRRLVQAFS